MQQTESIQMAVRRFIEDNYILEERLRTLADDDSLIEHQVLDSTGFMELIAFLEETYAIRVADEEMLPENLDSLVNIAAYVEKKCAVRSAAGAA